MSLDQHQDGQDVSAALPPEPPELGSSELALSLEFLTLGSPQESASPCDLKPGSLDPAVSPGNLKSSPSEAQPRPGNLNPSPVNPEESATRRRPRVRKSRTLLSRLGPISPNSPALPGRLESTSPDSPAVQGLLKPDAHYLEEPTHSLISGSAEPHVSPEYISPGPTNYGVSPGHLGFGACDSVPHPGLHRPALATSPAPQGHLKPGSQDTRGSPRSLKSYSPASPNHFKPGYDNCGDIPGHPKYLRRHSTAILGRPTLPPSPIATAGYLEVESLNSKELSCDQEPILPSPPPSPNSLKSDLSVAEGSTGLPAQRARNRSSEHIPAPGPLEAGQLYFSNQIWTRLSVEQQTKLGAYKVGSKNKSFKTRPWLVVKVGQDGDDGKVWVMCCTTRNRCGWQGVTWRDSASFLPMAPTAKEFDRPVLELQHDPREVFCGGSLLFLEVYKEVRACLLGDYIGQITPGALEIVMHEKSSLDVILAKRFQDYQKRVSERKSRGNPRWFQQLSSDGGQGTESAKEANMPKGANKPKGPNTSRGANPAKG